MFKKAKPEVRYQVVEIEKGTKLPELTGDLKESLKTLPQIPAFNYLLQRLRLQRAALISNLALEAEPSKIKYLQAGIYWLGHMENEISHLTKNIDRPRPAVDVEAEEFAKMRESLTLVGA